MRPAYDIILFASMLGQAWLNFWLLQVASCVQQIQNELPKARVVYCSATGMSEVGNMAFMSRLVGSLQASCMQCYHTVLLCSGLHLHRKVP